MSWSTSLFESLSSTTRRWFEPTNASLRKRFLVSSSILAKLPIATNCHGMKLSIILFRLYLDCKGLNERYATRFSLSLSLFFKKMFEFGFVLVAEKIGNLGWRKGISWIGLGILVRSWFLFRGREDPNGSVKRHFPSLSHFLLSNHFASCDCF